MEKQLKTAAELVCGNRYPGRGILVGESADGKCAVLAYFIMGRSENSRNRVLEADGDVLRTRPFDESKVKDPSLIIYAAMRRVRDAVVITNGDQTDTVADALSSGGDFFSALDTRTFEPDAPNFTPRISALLSLTKNGFSYKMSILRKGNDGDCEHGKFCYAPQAGVGHLLHTYQGDGAPLPSFAGAPREAAIQGSIDDVATALWTALDEENKIALFVRFINLTTGETETRLSNKHQRSSL